MKILMINKFLYPNGGSETYMFQLGQYLQDQGHEVQYFGMEHPERIVGNCVDAYTANMDFHGGSKVGKLLYPIKTIYSWDARKKIGQVLSDFKPDICHLNNFNYQLTPSIILEIRKRMPDCRIIYTAHDYQLVCPNHMCRNPGADENCEKCLTGRFAHCIMGKCIHGSLAKSVVGAAEATFWKWSRVYKELDTVVCCSDFVKTKIDTNPLLATKSVVLHNFVEQVEQKAAEKKDYVLYFGRYSKEKGIETLVRVAKQLQHIRFVFAGSGPMEGLLEGIPNIVNVGFQTGSSLEQLIREARFTVYPSEWYENCPFSVMESQMYGTPVLGADIGGIPELIRVGESGELFESGNEADLREKISDLWGDMPRLERYTAHCKCVHFDGLKEYTDKLMPYYRGM